MAELVPEPWLCAAHLLFAGAAVRGPRMLSSIIMLWIGRRVALSLALVSLCVGSACSLETQGTGVQNSAAGAPSSGGNGGNGGVSGMNTGGGSGSENCLDGKDNNGNNLIDCADPACQSGFECAPPVPGGWQGYYRLFQQKNNAAALAPSACPDGSQPTRMFTTPAQASCSQCQCGALTGAQCRSAQLQCTIKVQDCSSGLQDWTAAVPDGNSCYKNGKPNVLSCQSNSPPVANSGSCQPSGGTYQNQKHLFDGLVDVCNRSPSGGGCSPGQACVQRTTGTYAGALCIRSDGDVKCPSSWATTRIVAYQSGVDQRGCTPCRCTTDSSESCSPAAYTFFDYDGCYGTQISVTGGCVDLSSLVDLGTWGARLTSAPVVTGSCTVSGGNSTGSVQVQGTATFCCQQL